MRKLGIRAINDNGYWTYCGILIHRVIASELRGRALEPHEHVHHIDGNKLNNEHYNLMVCSDKEHKYLHRWPTPELRSKDNKTGPWRPNYE